MGRFLLAVVAALVLAGPASAYPWPVKPFDRQHPIRGAFGDPRTVFGLGPDAIGSAVPGSFTFHNGVDIVAPGGTRVYPVRSGTARLLDGATVVLQTAAGVTFQYFHLKPLVHDGQRVTALKTELGTVLASAGHVHLSEIDGTAAVNPLQPGHLAPYRDRTRPWVADVEFRDSAGMPLSPAGVCGTVGLVAEAYDSSPIPVTGEWAGLPVAPALVTWRIDRLDGSSVVPERTAVDFRHTEPPNSAFWRVYAHGTYQNVPRFGRQQFGALPGRFLFELDPALDVGPLGTGVYALTVTATDIAGNAGSLTTRFAVSSAACAVAPPAVA